jgi:hypothetical protein
MTASANDLKLALRELQRVADQLHLDRLFDVVPGSSRMGIAYQLEEARTGAPPYLIRIGRGRTEATAFLVAMTAGLDTVRRFRLVQGVPLSVAPEISTRMTSN